MALVCDTDVTRLKYGSFRIGLARGNRRRQPNAAACHIECLRGRQLNALPVRLSRHSFSTRLATSPIRPFGLTKGDLVEPAVVTQSHANMARPTAAHRAALAQRDSSGAKGATYYSHIPRFFVSRRFDRACIGDSCLGSLSYTNVGRRRCETSPRQINEFAR
ncbi:hypothetical protein BS50DRAFT_43489 [Corynespora cassiicola Philippines]|uniref:Uncharacterized protein n=1 Tax=Corynespora cassiicola Philippines TaxID=1448308 RepID=A0A2T2PD60_CORCC|nr:hypothetical protein BS50DRAFT_43489 [Corynespora cassiicola Philippines]